jgi:hypothetical protein
VFLGLGNPRKHPQNVGEFIGDLLAVLKMFWADFKDVSDRFLGCCGEISRMF